MFYETEAGRLQNLYLLQDVRVIEGESDYSIGYVQSNGVIITEGNYEDYETAKEKRDQIASELVAIDNN